MKHKKLLLPRIKVTKMLRLTSLLPDMPRLSSPNPRLTHGGQYVHLSLSPKSDPESGYSLLGYVAVSSSSSPNFPNCSFPRESASVFAYYLRSHFSVSQPKALRSRGRGYLSKVCRASCLKKSHFSFCFPFSHVEFS